MLEKDKLIRLEEYVLAHLDEALDVAKLARLVGLSASHFSRVFAKAAGRSPHRFVVDLRLQRAIELIETNQFRLADIATITGFSDQSHLARWMRRVHGVTLSDLRRSGLELHKHPERTASASACVCSRSSKT